jgi:CheY-like chemotaxis protein/HPt (histidine-containing phosphotransfer) domain-containing protein
VIADVLDFSKIEAGRLDLERVSVALPELIEGGCDTLVPAALDKGVELVLFIAPDVPARVWGDPTRLRQVLVNLVGNAVKFSAGRSNQRGRVSTRVELIAGDVPTLVLRVADNGVGMAPQVLEHLFTEFTQGEASTTRRFGGTGLGLAICKRLVTLMRGTIDVRSQVGEGSTFTVSLPIEPMADTREVSVPDPDLSGLECILVGTGVDLDDLRIYLEHAGAKVHRVDDVQNALRAAASRVQPIVVHAPQHGLSPDSMQADLAALSGTRMLSIERGRRRDAQRGPMTVTLDGNCLRRSALLHAVTVLAGRGTAHAPSGDDDEDSALVALAPPSIADARANSRLILVAEDDDINQKIILQQIELLGHAAEVANDGAEALRLWREGRYALLLTDLHMPQMDGYTLAESIRREESQRGLAAGQRMPILALTANTLSGEATRTQAAGMDGYLTKPLRLELLKAELRRWLPRERGDTRPAELDDLPGPPASPAVDVGVLKSLVGDDVAIVREFLSDYRVAAVRLLGELRAADASHDTRAIASIAHKLKSSSRSVGALGFGDLCAELENACRSGTRGEVSQCLRTLRSAHTAVDAEIGRLLARPIIPTSHHDRS